MQRCSRVTFFFICDPKLSYDTIGSYISGILGISSHMPQGQAPVQNPHPIHLDSSTTYSKPVCVSFRLMAPSGQTATQIPQSLQFPQEAQSWLQSSKLSASCLGL